MNTISSPNQKNLAAALSPSSVSSTPLTYTEVKPDWFIIPWFLVAHSVAFIGPFYYTSMGAIWTALGLYYFTGCLGITFGYHRLLTHRSFQVPKWLERFAATAGVLALQRSPVEWVGHHRMHHAFSDTNKDPHNARQGFWWSHLNWMTHLHPAVHDHKTLKRFARDIAADPYLNWLTNPVVQIGMQVALGLGLLFVGGIEYVVWGIFVRLVVLYHVTWLVNSATHKWGYRNYEVDDLSRNNWWVGLLAFGEGWHNNHHAHPSVAPAGHRWWEFDQTWLVIKGLKALGLATNIKMPPMSDLSPIASSDSYPRQSSNQSSAISVGLVR